MKHTSKRLTALVLALAMCFSLLAPAWAADVEAEEEVTAEVVAEDTEEVVEEEAEEPAEGETEAEEPAEEPEEEPDEAEAEVAAAEAEDEEPAEDEENAVVSAQSTIASGTCGTNLTWTLDDAGTLTISGTGNMEGYDYIDYDYIPWYDYRSSITFVTIEDGVTSIGGSAFYKCTGLTSVTIPDSVTSIGNYAFSHCTSLTGVTIPDSVTSIGYATFYCCKSLTSVTIPDSVTSIDSSAFYGCSSLTSVTIPDSVTSIGGAAFGGCKSLTSVTLAKGVTSVFGVYYNGEGEDYYVSAFYACTSLTNITVDVENTTFSSLDGVLFNKDQTELVSCPEGKSGEYVVPDSVTSIGDYAFQYCTGLTSVTIPDSVTSIGSSAFDSTSLTDVYYTGSEDDWAAISIGSYNNPLTDATIHYTEDTQVDLSTCTVTVASATYTGSALTPAVTVKDASGNTLTSGTDYTVAYKNNTNAGTGTVTVTGTGNYTGSVSKTFTIAKASQTVTATAAASSIYAGKTTTVTGKGTGTITYSSSDTSVATVSSAGKVTGKKPGTVTITVKAAGNSNYNAASKTVKITVKLNKTTISSLTNTSKGVTVKWSKVTGASGYYIYRNDKQVKKITSGSTVSYTDTGAKTNGAKYQYKIYAYYGSTKSAASATKTTYYVSSPTISSLKNSASKKMTVKWGKNAKATGYQIQYSTSSDFSSYKTVTVTSYKTVSKTISSLTKGKKYYVRVRAYKTVSGTKYYSAWSGKKSVKISK